MNAKAKEILVSVAFCLGGGLLAVNSISTSFAADSATMNGDPVFGARGGGRKLFSAKTELLQRKQRLSIQVQSRVV